MATTKIWPVRDSLKRVVQYAENHLKTANPNFYSAEEMQDLQNVLSYAADEEKTQMQYYVTGINCIDKIAYEQMMVTKERFGKTDGNLAYHAYQSFMPDEVTPERCHEIGIEIARRIWGDRYEIVVSTHLNTKCVHNHFVINSVSFVDGKKLNNDYAMYFSKLRRESDKICREYGLSVIEYPASTPTPRNIYLAEKAREPTRYNIMRQDIDEGIKRSFTAKHLGNYLRGLGYEINFSETRKYWTISLAGDKRATRLERLGENYSNEAIRRRILANTHPKFERTPLPQRKQYRFRGSFRNVRKITGFRALYLHYCYLLGVFPKRKEPQKPLSPQMRLEVRKFQKYTAEIRLLWANKIDTAQQMNDFINKQNEELSAREKERQRLYNQMKTAHPDNLQLLRSKRDEVSDEIKKIRRNLFYCRDILQRSAELKQNIASERKIRNKTYEQPSRQKPKFKERGYSR